MEAPRTVLDLVDRFDAQRDYHMSTGYNETQLRCEFLNPLFGAMGWDIDNQQGYAEQFRHVVHEDSIRIGGAIKAPDYSFRLGGRRIFFLEAKKPSVNLKENPLPAYQLRRYAWTAKLPVSILSDFEEFIVYDTRVKPAPGDKASTARVLYIPYTEYPQRWEEITSLFSPQAIQKGALDKYVESTTKKRGTAEVDDAFLAEIEEWRDLLARNIALRNRNLSQRELNDAVQTTIDRIVFLRICEDRAIEPYAQLQALLSGNDTYARLRVLFERADERYNSGLFHFHKETNRNGAPDTLTPGLTIDDKTLKTIFKRLYYPDSPYEFSVLPAEILGQVYERFLGSVIRLTAGGQAKVEQKPEVRKAGGVYYTPSYIVDYIVKHTVGKLLEGKTPQEVAGLSENWRPSKTARPLAILDPACGSGSFLLGAYQYLLDWHLDYYLKDAAKWSTGKEPRIYQDYRAVWRLATSERKRILLANIYGVDIDSQAVEVTKLSLLLRVLEGESADTLQKQFSLFHERALPDLANNIKCGNSLIGPDFYQGRQTDFDEEEAYRINAFDWNTEFPQIMQAGGFDAVIGNPPYIPIEMMTTEVKHYYVTHHPQLERKYDSAAVFILAMLKRLTLRGRLGFISSMTWQTGENYSMLREFLFTQAGVERIVNLPFNVFPTAYVDTGVYVLTNEPCASYSIYRFEKKERAPDLSCLQYTTVLSSLIGAPDYRVVLDPAAREILWRCEESTRFLSLGQMTISTQGLAPGRYQRKAKVEKDSWYPFLEKGQVYRYALQVEEITFADMTPHKSLARFYDAQDKLLIRRVINRQDRLMATITKERMLFKKDINPFVITEKGWDATALLAVMNSSLLSYLYVNTSSIATKDDFRQTTLAELRRLPIPHLSDLPSESSRLSSMAQRMLDLHKRLQAVNTDHESTILQRQIAATDDEIDRLVYELYELTAEEIAIVEESARK